MNRSNQLSYLASSECNSAVSTLTAKQVCPYSARNLRKLPPFQIVESSQQFGEASLLLSNPKQQTSCLVWYLAKK